ncbi:MAG: metallophosphoesterase [Bacilli bacterium]|nr:metallophosphoesterase [Bacilli bacterium]
MKIARLLALASVGLFSLSSCAHHTHYEVKDYYIDLDWENTSEPFNILQLSDLHISSLTDNEKEYKFIKETVDQARKKFNNQIDLIVITGDLFTFASKQVARDTFAFFDSLKIPWAPTWGNHDEQNYYSVDWLTGYLNDLNKKRKTDGSSYCVFRDLQDDDMYGNANYVINLERMGSVAAQLFIFDSNRYNYGEYFGYDYIHSDQVDWYERIAMQENISRGYYLPSLAFFHIPFPEFEEAYQFAKKGEQPQDCEFITDASGVVRDKHDSPTSTGDPKLNTHLFNKMRHYNTQGVFVGHNHTSNYCVEISTEADFADSQDADNSIQLCFGYKGTDSVYYDPDMLGGQVISITLEDGDKENLNIDITSILHQFPSKESV